jgi:hypothetical protein
LNKEEAMRRVTIAMLLAGCLSCTAGQAQTPEAPVQPQTERGVQYLCGGVGQDESEYMKTQARSHGLLMTFATRDGSYLAKVHIDIADRKGAHLLAVDCDAPMLLVDLPPANGYRILAQTGGVSLHRTASVKSGGNNRAVFVWPSQDGPSEKPTRAEKRGLPEPDGPADPHGEPQLRSQSEMRRP